MILEEFISYYKREKNKKIHAKEILLSWLKSELSLPPKKNYQKVLHSELEIINGDSVAPKNSQGVVLLNSLLRIIGIIEEKEYEATFVSPVRSKDCLNV